MGGVHTVARSFSAIGHDTSVSFGNGVGDGNGEDGGAGHDSNGFLLVGDGTIAPQAYCTTASGNESSSGISGCIVVGWELTTEQS
eukprot:jgi/Phyca11/504270/fgenesh2_kg.PHYCAscaffold_7_\